MVNFSKEVDYKPVTPDDFHLVTAPHMVLRGPEKLFARLSSILHPPSTLPIIASIADVHANAKGLEAELRLCQQAHVDRIIATGDFIDRDRENLPVMQRVSDLTAKGYMRPLGGNHDEFATLAIYGSTFDFRLWMRNGGITVLEEIGGDPGEIAKELRRLVLPYEEIGLSFGKATNEMLKANESFLMQCMEVLTASPILNNIADWNSENLSLFEINEYGTLYVHAGIECDLLGNMDLQYPFDDPNCRGLLALAKMDGELHNALRNRDLDAPILKTLRGRNSPQWIRDWHHPLFLAEDAERFMNQLGVTSIIVGHTVVEKTVNYGSGRVIFADRGLAKSYLDQPGVIIISPERSMECITSSKWDMLEPTDGCRSKTLFLRMEKALPHARRIMAEAENFFLN